MQKENEVIHVVAEQLEDLTMLLARLAQGGEDLEALARCDEVRRPVEERRGQRASGGRESRLQRLLREMPELAADLDVPARGSAHSPSRKAGSTPPVIPDASRSESIRNPVASRLSLDSGFAPYGAPRND